MAALTWLDESSGFIFSEIFEMVQFVWNVYVLKEFLVVIIAFLKNGIDVEDRVVERLHNFGMGDIDDVNLYKEKLERLMVGAIL